MAGQQASRSNPAHSIADEAIARAPGCVLCRMRCAPMKGLVINAELPANARNKLSFLHGLGPETVVDRKHDQRARCVVRPSFRCMQERERVATARNGKRNWIIWIGMKAINKRG